MNETDQRQLRIRTRGIQRAWDPRVWGTLIGAAGATVFVMAYRGALMAPWPVVAVVVWAVALLAYIVLVFVTPRVFTKASRVGAGSGFIYLGSVAGMLLLIRLGTIVLDNADKAELRAAVIVVAVGLHFIPFAVAFHTPMFTPLGVIMAILGAVGLTVGWLWHTRAAAAMAVISGIVMLAIIAADAVRTVPQPSSTK
ncbi:hypothetical protein IV500_14720 [Paeniglutamicibacter antarcticus]|uniref:Uncharacterized protein n=1 Tax=Arthrobacter terrae TaxID=2935737 RepID=A0A931CR49_9MICC|nr:hypothetical protein [Arthrobacter terrae]MBG0740631.1 hypothetical protein [Arthrobacter terrae]